MTNLLPIIPTEQQVTFVVNRYVDASNETFKYILGKALALTGRTILQTYMLASNMEDTPNYRKVLREIFETDDKYGVNKFLEPEKAFLLELSNILKQFKSASDIID